MSDTQAQVQMWSDERIIETVRSECLMMHFRNGTQARIMYQGDVNYIVKRVRDEYETELATLRAAARALYAALHEREHCEVCGGVGSVLALGDMTVPCSCRITAGRALDNWEEVAKGDENVE